MAGTPLTIRLGGKGGRIDPTSFTKAMRHTMTLLEGIDRNISDKTKPTLCWFMSSMKMTSPAELVLVSELPSDSDFPAIEVTRPFTEGIRTIEKEARCPQFFKNEELQEAKQLASMLNDGIEHLAFEAPDEEEVPLTQHTAANVDAVIGWSKGPYDADATLYGKLEMISIHGSHSFSIYDPITNQPIKCDFDPKFEKDVIDSLGRRVRVYGKAKFNKKHWPHVCQGRFIRDSAKAG